MIEIELTSKFKGSTLDIDKLEAEEWNDQFSELGYFALPEKEGLWAKLFLPVYQCNEETVWIFISIQLTKRNKVRNIKSDIHHVFPDGSGKKIKIPLFEPDRDNVSGQIEKLLAKTE